MRLTGRLAAAMALVCALTGPAAAQFQRVVTIEVGGTIAVTNTFQQALAARDARTGCTLQNTGTNAMYVYFGATADATIAKSFKLTAGQSISCGIGNVILTDAIQITGTATEAYAVASQ